MKLRSDKVVLHDVVYRFYGISKNTGSWNLTLKGNFHRVPRLNNYQLASTKLSMMFFHYKMKLIISKSQFDNCPSLAENDPMKWPWLHYPWKIFSSRKSKIFRRWFRLCNWFTTKRQVCLWRKSRELQ